MIRIILLPFFKNEIYMNLSLHRVEYSIFAGGTYSMKKTMTAALKPFAALSLITLTTMIIVVLSAKLLFPYLEFSSPFGKAQDLSSDFFIDMITLESRILPSAEEGDSTFSYQNISLFLANLFIGVHLDDPKSLLASTVSAMEYSRPVLLYKGNAKQHDDYPVDHTPYIAEEPYGPPVPEKLEQEEQAPTDTVADGEPEIFILHSHNRESWLPELPHIKQAYLAQHKELNITKVGERLSEKLTDLGFDVLHSKTDYAATYKDDYPRYNYYGYSRKSIQEAFAVAPKLQYVFDIHRDSGKRDTTTIEHEGVAYGQTYFVVGMENQNWEANHALAKKLHDKLNEKIPGISKGIFGKDKSEGNGVYNQDLHDNVTLIEIGGVENTLEESNRTADILAEVIQDIYTEAQQMKDV